MSKRNFKDGDGFRNIDRALWLLTAWRSKSETPPGQNEWLQAEIRELIPSIEAEDLAVTLGAMITAFLQVSTAFLDGWALASDQDAAALLAVTRRINEINLRRSENDP